jgi:hypothetical protein
VTVVTDRRPEPWESSAAGPFLTMAGGREQVVVGFDEARETAHAFADRLDA